MPQVSSFVPESPRLATLSILYLYNREIHPLHSGSNRLELKFEIVSERLYERVYEVVVVLEFQNDEECKHIIASVNMALSDAVSMSRSVSTSLAEARRPASVLEFKIVSGNVTHSYCHCSVMLTAGTNNRTRKCFPIHKGYELSRRCFSCREASVLQTSRVAWNCFTG